MSHPLVLQLLDKASDNYEQVLFEIDADPSVTTKAFAEITKLSYFQREQEV